LITYRLTNPSAFGVLVEKMENTKNY